MSKKFKKVMVSLLAVLMLVGAVMPMVGATTFTKTREYNSAMPTYGWRRNVTHSATVPAGQVVWYRLRVRENVETTSLRQIRVRLTLMNPSGGIVADTGTTTHGRTTRPQEVQTPTRARHFNPQLLGYFYGRVV